LDKCEQPQKAQDPLKIQKKKKHRKPDNDDAEDGSTKKGIRSDMADKFDMPTEKL
jgi:hypothetical protein